MTTTQNPANHYDETTATAAFGDTLDEVRANGLLSVCLGCGTTTATPQPRPTEAARRLYADMIDWDAVDCCPDADRINY